jgi:hypothetical protein
MVRRAGVWLTGVLVLGMATAAGEAGEALDPLGGWQQSEATATGWFRTQRAEGRWWLVNGLGHRFLSVGVNTVSFRPDVIRGTDRAPYHEAVKEKYRHEEGWAEAAVERLRGWGFNTLGAWSAPVTWRQETPYTVILDFGRLVDPGEGRSFPDVFDPAFESAAMRHARQKCGPLAEDPALIGYFTDNELRWGGEERGPEALFAGFLGREDSAPGRRALLRFLERRYLRIEELNEAWGTRYDSFEQVGRTPQVGSSIPREDQLDFMRLAAEEYFRVTHDAIRAVDAHHLILGCRFAGSAPESVLQAMRRYVDVVSLNHYDVHAPAGVVRAIHRIVGKPVLITEFGFRARDSGLPNTRGAGAVVKTQRERAEHFERYVRELMALPMVVGYHWFEHSDQPAEGRFDGENSNYGLVDIRDEPYAELVEVMERVNGSVYELAMGRSGQPGEI